MAKKSWLVLLLVVVAGGSGVVFMGVRTYRDAPPLPDFVDASGKVVASAEAILDGQSVFQQHALMDYGSMFGDGAGRGPDYTADALHAVAEAMRARIGAALEPAAADARVKGELKANRYDPATNRVTLTEAQVEAFGALLAHETALFTGDGAESMKPRAYLSDAAELRALTAFFFWGAWVCSSERPGSHESWTHNWPYDPAAGNVPGPALLLWSVFGLLALALALGVVLFAHGRAARAAAASPEPVTPPLGVAAVAAFRPTPTQRAAWRFFVLAAAVFVVQVLAGVLTVHDFVKLTSFFGVDLQAALPVTVARGWHVQLSLLWIALCWIGGSIFVLPMFAGKEPRGQLVLVNGLFVLALVVGAGTCVGIYLGPMGLLGPSWRLLGNQGWEIVEMGRLWQGLLFVALIVWAVVVVRGVRPVMTRKDPVALPSWLAYAVGAVVVLFTSGFVAGPRENFVIADFWRWMVVHMWAEAFLEVLTTVVVACFMVLMGLVTAKAASRIVTLAALLFLGSGILGISHNFYWNAKPVVTLALGAVFSTLQVVPLMLLAADAWRTRMLPADALREAKRPAGDFGQSAAFLFLLGVSFWNFFGAGVLGLAINLPIVNYYEHGTTLTVNHGHAALMGVYGNLSLAALVFVGRYLVRPERFPERLMRIAFWSLNAGLALTVLLDLLPAGVLQLDAVLENGFWFARSQAFIDSPAFQTLTWLRAVGGPIFVVGGLIPLAWFALSRARGLKDVAEETVAPVVPGGATRGATLDRR